MKVYILTFNYNTSDIDGSIILAVKTTRESAEKELANIIAAICNGKVYEKYAETELNLIPTSHLNDLRVKEIVPSYYEITDNFRGDHFSLIVTANEVTD